MFAVHFPFSVAGVPADITSGGNQNEREFDVKTAGIVGGIGPESTIEYYRQILACYREACPDGNPLLGVSVLIMFFEAIRREVVSN